MAAYVHRSAAGTRSARPSRAHEQIFDALRAHGRSLAHRRAIIRGLTARRNAAIFEAVEDGVSLTTIAAAVGLSSARVRSAGLSAGEPEEASPPGTAGRTRDEHLRELKDVAGLLQNAVADRSELETRIRQIIDQARALGLDDERLPHLGGLPAASLRRVGRRPE